MSDSTATNTAATVQAAQDNLNTPPVQGDETSGNVKHIGYLGLIVRRFMRQKSAIVGVVILLLLIVLALFGSHLSKWSFDDPDFTALSAGPSASHWLGTDPGGSDLFALLVHGLGKSLMIGIITSVATTFIAAIIGTAISFFQGWFERVGMWVLDMLLVIPTFLLIAIIVRAANATAGWIWLIVGLTMFGWVGYARILRTLTLSLRERDYVKAARFMGVSSFKIILRHLIPNLGSVLIINTVLGVVGAVNSETALSYLGLGIKAPDVSLGSILQTGASTTMTAPWLLIFPSIALILLTFSMQLIGDGLRDAMDPNSRASGEA
ncbi:MAG: ABC transporter permease [Bifidobacterium sp.]|uniref:Oligopeptide transport system permease protein OppC n=1 Tax=Bifidobacterium fermentum TaxID=3059035 RepID=A0AB39UFA6_9BIFI